MALLDTPEINEAIVMSREDQHRGPSLVAYLVPTDQPDPSTSELHNFLMSRLPDCMIPAAFVMLTAMPLTTNGKVDRRALPDPGSARPNLITVYTRPTTTMEARLTSIWSDMLSKNPVGVHDNFFDLGGHSFAAFRVITRIVQTFSWSCP